MRTTVWYAWCFVLGAALGMYGLNFIEHPVWFIAVDLPLILASWYGFEMLWPRNINTSEGESE